MLKFVVGAILAAGVAVVVSSAASAGSGGPTFSNQVLRAPAVLPPGVTTSPPGQSGDSEPAIDFGGPDNTMAVDGLGWLPFAVNLWKGHFGDTPPQFFGAMDTSLPIQGKGRVNLGDGDADVEVTSVGTILLADLDIIFSHTGQSAQLGVSVTRCPATAASKADCTSTLLDTSGADRPWLTTSGTTAYVSWHNAANSSQITVDRSTNDGRSWTRVASPVLGQGSVTGNATFNNSIGPIVADPSNPNIVYQPFASGEASVQKGTSSAFNNIYVARSTDGGNTWTTKLVFHKPLFTDLANFWPSATVDAGNGDVYVTFTDRSTVWVSSSSDQGANWTTTALPGTPATTVMPALAALNGKVDVVYYGTSPAASNVSGTLGDASTVWNTYDTQRSGGVWNTGLVSNTSNRVGPVCLNGSACAGNTNRELLDLFEVAEDPANGEAAVIYTETTTDTWTGSDGVTRELPEIVLAYEQ
jgi:hypothetical protein